MAVGEARVEQAAHGVVRWRRAPRMGLATNFGGEILFDQLGIGLRHTMIGADGERTARPDWGPYVADPVATAHERFPRREFTRYDGWLDSV